jgi:mRNA interferase MazF
MKADYGQIWFADLDPVRFNEQGGKRPVVVASGGVLNTMPIRHAYVVPLTTRNRGLPHHVEVSGFGLERPSWAMPEALSGLSAERFIKYLGWASPDTMADLDEWIDLFTRPTDF